jgi:alpha-tubulin suppressor-like RCC1 family protein
VINDARLVTAGASHTCFVSTAGSLYCAGDDSLGQLGTNSTESSASPEYFHAVALSNVTHLAAGYSHTCAVTAGNVYCWGSNSQGQVGQAGGGTRTTPVQVAGLSNVTALALGISHSCALTGGNVYCWGLGTSGQLGVDTDTSATPVRAGLRGGSSLLGPSDRLTAGGYHTCARESSGWSVKCWGGDSSGQLADGTNNAGEDNDPTTIQPL